MASNINSTFNVHYSGPQHIGDAIKDVGAGFCYGTVEHYLQGQKVSKTLSNYENDAASSKNEVSSLKGRITKLEEAINHPTRSDIALRVAKTVGLIFAYMLLAATVIGIAAITYLEIEEDAFAKTSQGNAPFELRRVKPQLATAEQQVKFKESVLKTLTDFRDKAPAIIQILEERIERFKETDKSILENAATNPMWYALAGNNFRAMRQYELALNWLKEAAVN